ncbi:hypothetical protein EJ08DRAFT_630536 [Tothia fuscella]|uniref:chitinase n=1 Tax=Tothia fuscella TaxID=1048955 RepID=A0A9P4NWA4_9PEZI|nr:hypothetical protein EJ08DRAFT_630536 [Tothia fuscella]
MNSRLTLVALTGLSLLSQAAGQTWTHCNPMNTTCPSNPALGSNATFNFVDERPNNKVWNQTAGPMKYGSGGAEFTVAERGQSPTIQSNFYILFGTVSVIMQAARGQGIISSIVLESDDLDEVDWEFIGGNETHVESNYFGKGNTSSFDRAIYHPLDFIPQDSYHNYSTLWTAEKMEWWIDNKLVRTLLYGEANGGYNFPQTPMNVRLGIWAGGDVKNSKGTIEWAGGLTEYKSAYSMFIKSVDVRDFSTGSSYTYGDHSGSWQSIKIAQGNSTILKEIIAPSGVSGHWKALPKTARTAIIACAIGGFVILLLAVIAFCIVQGRKGKKERAIADAQWAKEQQETNQYRMQMMKGGFSYEHKPVQNS